MRLIDPKAKTNLLYVSDLAFEQMQKIPTIDAEPVVRCGECRHFEHEFDGVGHCRYAGINLDHMETGFCSYGERKDGAEDG